MIVKNWNHSIEIRNDPFWISIKKFNLEDISAIGFPGIFFNMCGHFCKDYASGLCCTCRQVSGKCPICDCVQ